MEIRLPLVSSTKVQWPRACACHAGRSQDACVKAATGSGSGKTNNGLANDDGSRRLLEDMTAPHARHLLESRTKAVEACGNELGLEW